jgi:capsular polysaccharide biosynthesis protein
MYSQSRKEEYTDKVYLSRSKLSFRERTCINEKRLEAILQDHGFGIFHPQEMSLADQIGLWNRAKIVVGTWGSALSTMLFSEVSQKTILCLTDGGHDGTFIGVDRICAADTKYVRCMYRHPFCMKNDAAGDRIIDVPRACQGILQYI